MLVESVKPGTPPPGSLCALYNITTHVEGEEVSDMGPGHRRC